MSPLPAPSVASHLQREILPAGIVVYLTCATEFILRYLHDRPVRKIPDVRLRDLHYLSYDYKLMLVGLMFSTVCIFIRFVLS